MKLSIKKRAVALAIAGMVTVITMCCGFSLIKDEVEQPEVVPTVSTTEVLESQLDETPQPEVTETEVVAAPASEEVKVVWDKTKPIYEVYKDGFAVEVPADLQWYIREMCEKYDFPEKPIYGMILCESTFDPSVYGAGCYGLCQINKFWIRGANIEHFTDDYRSRDLLNPKHNILTLMEMWCYARDAYDLDPYKDADMVKLLYWHNTGKDPRRVTSWSYASKALRYADELVLLQGE